MSRFSVAASVALLGFVSVQAIADIQTISVKQGWNLVGSRLDGVPVMTSFNNIKSVWTHKNGAWQAYSSDSVLQGKLAIAKIANLTQINSGDGFWIYSDNNTSMDLNGTTPSSTELAISSGWQLLSPKKEGSLGMDYFNKPEVTTVWKYKDGHWLAYTPQDTLKSAIGKLNLDELVSVSAGEGFWVNASGTTSDLNLPPQIGIALLLKDKLNALPLADADVYLDGVFIGKTKQNGQFSIPSGSDGKKIVIKKSGVTAAVGIVKNGKAVMITQLKKSIKSKITDIANAKEITKGFTSADGAGILKVNSATGVSQDLTLSVEPFISTAAAPVLNDVANAQASQMSIIGGAFLEVEDTNGTSLSTEEINGVFNMSFEQTSLLGELEAVLNGYVKTPSVNFEQFSADAFTQLQSAITSEQIKLLTLQYINGAWVEKGTASLIKYIKKQKALDGTTKSITKYKLGTSEVVLDKFAPIAFAMKMEFLTGTTTISVKDAGYKMFDGTVVTKSENNASNFDWIDAPVGLATAIGDDAITSGAGMTGEDGSYTLTYKVPFLSPNFSVSIKKDGYYDTMVTCDVDGDKTTCTDAHMYKIPDTASIAGYVKNKVTKEGIKEALVTLVNPEVLSADKIEMYKDEDGNSGVKVGYFPTVTYTWTASKIDDDNTTKSVMLKTGTGEDKAMLSETELMTALVLPYDKGEKPSEIVNPTGKWDLHVQAVQTFTNDESITEEAIGSFNIDILMPKLAEVMGSTISEKKVAITVNADGEQITLDENLLTSAVYGGKNAGFLYRTGTQLDDFKWTTQLLAAETDEENCDIEDPAYIESDICVQKVVENPSISTKSLYPFGNSVKYMTKNFTSLLKPDLANANKPFYKSGFTLRIMAEGTLDFTDVNDKGIVKQSNASYTDFPEDKIDTLTQLVDVPSIDLVGASATAYMRQTITEDDGGYYINMIPVELNNKLQVFAKATGYKFDSELDVKLVNDLATGYVSQYNLELVPVPSTITPPEVPVISSDFSTWSEGTSCTTNSKWNKLTSIPTELLADNFIASSNYLWFGNLETKTFEDSSLSVCGQIESAEFDLTNNAFPELKFKTWFEVESVDVAKKMFDQMTIGIKLMGTTAKVVYLNNGTTLTLQPYTFYPINVLNPDNEPAIQSETVGFSSGGVGMSAVWIDIKMPVDYLAGEKVKFVFDFHSKDANYNNFKGWGIDAVSIKDDMKDALMLPPSTPELVEVIPLTKKLR